MKLIGTNDPRVMEISEEWINFLDQHEQDFPQTATSMSLGQVFLYLMFTYKPPVEELLPIMELIARIYIKYNEDTGYKDKLN